MKNHEPEYGREVGGIEVGFDDFNERMTSALESFHANVGIHPMMQFTDIVTNDALFEQYKEGIVGDVLSEDASGSFSSISDEFGFFAKHAEKLDQLIENSRNEMVTEATSIGQLQPIVATTLPILKKEYLECNFKDAIPTVVATKPIVNIAYERKFLADASGNKYYLPDIFYNDDYKTVMAASVGTSVTNLWYPTSGSMPIIDLNVLTASGGTLASRDMLSYDFCIDQVKVTVDADPSGETPQTIVKTVPVHIQPDVKTSAFSHKFEVSDAKTTNSAKVTCQIFGSYDPYTGVVSITATGPVTQIHFGGHLSNQNNTGYVDLQRERKNMQVTIPEQERINTGITIEKIKDEKALANIDTTVELISDMTEVCVQTKDSRIRDFLEDSFQAVKTAGADFSVFGYNIAFAKSVEFTLQKSSDYMIPESEWRSKQLRYYLERTISNMKIQLRNTQLMFVITASPYCIDLLSATENGIKWVVDGDNKVGGVRLDYKVGVMQGNATRVLIISTAKETEAKGFRIVAYPLSETIITYKQYDYSFNIENNYRNSATPNTPNIMAVQRYVNYEFLPLQYEYYISEYRAGNLGFVPIEE